MRARVLVGTSGFSYRHWRGVLYPPGVPQSQWLETYCRTFPTVELNATFYRLPRGAVVDGWASRTPDDFVFSVKASRYITHIRRLKELGEAVAVFMESIAPLAGKLGCVLFQLPTGMRGDPDRLRRFLALLPAGRRYAFEFRHESWLSEEVMDILRGAEAALVLHDHRGFQSPAALTAGWTYMRFHGPAGDYRGEYGIEALKEQAERIREWSGRGVEILAYFNNDAGGCAVRDAAALQALLGSVC